MAGKKQEPGRRLYEPEQMIDMVTNLLNHMRLQQRDEADAVEASLYMLVEGLGYLVVRSTGSNLDAERVGMAMASHLGTFLKQMNKARRGAGVDLPAFENPVYAGDKAST